MKERPIMKIQLFYPPSKKRGRNPNWCYPPLGILYLAAYARKLYPDIEWKVSDGQLEGEDKCLKYFRSFQPDIIGVSFTTPHAAAAYEFINKLKKETPNTLVVCGGPHPTAVPNDVLNRCNADIVVVGEGELAFTAIIKDFKEGKTKVGDQKIVNGSLIEDINEIPFPARDLINLNKYPGWFFKRKTPETDFLSSRGCPYNCFFCSNPVWKVQKPWVRFRTPKNVVDEIELLYKEYGIREFFNECDEFNVNMKVAIGICDEIIKRKLDISWKVQLTARAKNLPEELIMKMAKSGCWLVMLGLESGNQETLDGIGKNITLAEVEHVCQSFKKWGIKVFGLFMIFNTWEEKGNLKFEGMQESLNTLNFARSLKKRKFLNYLSCTTTTPFPASPLWEFALRHKLFTEGVINQWELWDSSFNQIVCLPGVSQNDWRKVRLEGGKLQSYVTLSTLRQVNIKDLPHFAGRTINLFKLLVKR